MNSKIFATYLVILMFFSINSIAGSLSNWTTYYSDSEVKIEYQYYNCEYAESFNQEFVILKITNLTNNDINVSWYNESWYDKKCINCNQEKSDESFNKVYLKANEEVLGNCIDQNSLRIFSKFSDKIENMPGLKKIVKLTKFNLRKINVNYE